MNERFNSEELAERDPSSEIPIRFTRIVMKALADRRDDTELSDAVIAAVTVAELCEVLDEVLGRSEA